MPGATVRIVDERSGDRESLSNEQGTSVPTSLPPAAIG